MGSWRRLLRRSDAAFWLEPQNGLGWLDPEKKQQPAIPERPLRLSREESSRLTILPLSSHCCFWHMSRCWIYPIPISSRFLQTMHHSRMSLVVFEEKQTNKQQPYGRNDPLNWKLSRVFMWFVAKECFWTNPFKKNGQRTNISLNQASASLCVMLKLEAHIVFIHWSTAVLSHTNIDQCGTQQKLVASQLQKILGWETPGVRFSSAPWAAVSWEVWKRGNSFMALLSGMK